MNEGNYEDYLLREMNADAGENNNDADIGGNVEPDRVEANLAFGDWLDKHNDALPLPESFTQWLNQTGDSI